MKTNWIAVEDSLPPELETVWLYTRSKGVYLGCIAYDEGWIWAYSNGVIYAENGKIITECEMDDLDVTHWHPVPELP